MGFELIPQTNEMPQGNFQPAVLVLGQSYTAKSNCFLIVAWASGALPQLNAYIEVNGVVDVGSVFMDNIPVGLGVVIPSFAMIKAGSTFKLIGDVVDNFSCRIMGEYA